MNSHPMNDSVILVTGAGKGIGKAFVEAICGLPSGKVRGVRLLLTSRTRSDLETLEALALESALTPHLLPMDLTADPVLPVDECVRRFGRLDTVVHCAGVGRFGDLSELTSADLEHTVGTNLTATFLLLQRAYLQMRSQPLRNGLRGQISAVTSVAAEVPFEQSAIYCMTKYGQRGLLDVLRLHGRKDGIRILEVKPGATLTPMWGEIPPGQATKMMAPEDIALPMLDALSLPSRTTMESVTLRPLRGDL
jgi:sepiapterin reductase